MGFTQRGDGEKEDGKQWEQKRGAASAPWKSKRAEERSRQEARASRWGNSHGAGRRSSPRFEHFSPQDMDAEEYLRSHPLKSARSAREVTEISKAHRAHLQKMSLNHASRDVLVDSSREMYESLKEVVRRREEEGREHLLPLLCCLQNWRNNLVSLLDMAGRHEEAINLEDLEREAFPDWYLDEANVSSLPGCEKEKMKEQLVAAISFRYAQRACALGHYVAKNQEDSNPEIQALVKERLHILGGILDAVKEVLGKEFLSCKDERHRTVALRETSWRCALAYRDAGFFLECLPLREECVHFAREVGSDHGIKQLCWALTLLAEDRLLLVGANPSLCSVAEVEEHCERALSDLEEVERLLSILRQSCFQKSWWYDRRRRFLEIRGKWQAFMNRWEDALASFEECMDMNDPGKCPLKAADLRMFISLCKYKLSGDAVDESDLENAKKEYQGVIDAAGKGGIDFISDTSLIRSDNFLKLVLQIQRRSSSRNESNYISSSGSSHQEDVEDSRD